MPLRRMARLAEMLAPGNDGESSGSRLGEARFAADFAYDRQGLVTIRLSVEAELPLICQRSLAPYAERINRRSRLAVIETIEAQEEVPEQYEPVLVENRRLALLDIVEEELLLAVPQVPRNPALEDDSSLDTGIEDYMVDAESASSATEEEPTHRPFAGLAGLMKSNNGD